MEKMSSFWDEPQEKHELIMIIIMMLMSYYDNDVHYQIDKTEDKLHSASTGLQKLVRTDYA